MYHKKNQYTPYKAWMTVQHVYARKPVYVNQGLPVTSCVLNTILF